MRIRILDRILVAIAGLFLVAACSALAAQVFFGQDVIGLAAKLLTTGSVRRKIVIGVIAGILLVIGLYCVLMLFRHRRRHDKFILQKMETGELAISLNTLETMVKKCVEQHDEIKTDSIKLENQRDGLLIRIRGTVAGGISIPLTADTLQRQVKQYVTACSGVEVKGIRIQIEASGEDAKDAPFAIEPPTGNRLGRGEEPAEAEKEEEPAPAASAETSAEPAAEAQAEPETPAAGEEAAAAAAMAAAENLMQDLDTDDDRPIHQRLFSTKEEPCIMPLPPENTAPAADGESTETADVPAEEKKEDIPEQPETGAPEDVKGEDQK